MAKRATLKGKMIIAGPGAGKTHNMVAEIIAALPSLSPNRYLVVITYTNSATLNIVNRLSKRITIPANVFVGTMHSFLNRFIVIPFSTFNAEPVKKEKLFMQCGLDDVFQSIEKAKDASKRSKTPEDIAKTKAGIRKRLNAIGYITFDQTLSIPATCMEDLKIAKTIANRLAYLFVDEFQDSGNAVFNIIEAIRKQQKTNIYCVGDPEQYIQSFDSTIRSFANIPILRAAKSAGYDVQINDSNYRCSKVIVDFLNHFNGRAFDTVQFQQKQCDRANLRTIDPPVRAVYFLTGHDVLKPVIDRFSAICNHYSISAGERCLIAKKKKIIARLIAALGNRYKDPKKSTTVSPLKAIQDTLLTVLQMNQSQFCIHYQTDVNALRKYAIAIFKALANGTITNENTFIQFVTEQLKLTVKAGLPVKVENLRFDLDHQHETGVMTVSTIHMIKGLEAPAVLVVAETEAELLLWIETDQTVRDAKRTSETTDYPRLGYVAFSRAEHLLCIACHQAISDATKAKLESLAVQIDPVLATTNTLIGN